MEVIGRHIVTRCLTQGRQDLDALHDLTHGEGREPVEVDDTLPRQLRALVTLRPFLDITIKPHGGDVTTRHERHRLTIINKVRERQVTGVGMVHQLTETDAERTDRGRHQDIGTRSRLRTTLQGSPVQWPHLIGVVREVRVRTGIIERELTTDEQRALMMRGTERSAEGSTGLTVGHERVGEEETGLCREAVGDLTSLSHEAVLHLHTVIDRTTVADDGVLADDTRSDEYRSIHRTHHRTLRETGSTADLTVALDDGVRDVFGIDDLHIVAYIATVRTRHAELVFNHLLKRLTQAFVVVMLHHEGGQL